MRGMKSWTKDLHSKEKALYVLNCSVHKLYIQQNTKETCFSDLFKFSKQPAISANPPISEVSSSDSLLIVEDRTSVFWGPSNVRQRPHCIFSWISDLKKYNKADIRLRSYDRQTVRNGVSFHPIRLSVSTMITIATWATFLWLLYVCFQVDSMTNYIC